MEVSHLHTNIYTPRVFIPVVHRTNQGPALHGVDVEPTIHLWIHVGRMHDPRKTEEVPLPPAPPRFINKHTGHIGGDAVRLNHVSERPPIGRSETLAKQILLPHFCTVGKYLIDCRLCVCVCLLCLCFGVCVLSRGMEGGNWAFSVMIAHELSKMQKKLA